METVNGIIIEDEDTHFDTASIIAGMLKTYNDNELVELLCECETLLETNDTYLRKLNEHGFKKLYNLISGIEKKCRYQILGNSQSIHKITLAIQKIVLSRLNDLTLLVATLKENSDKDYIYTQKCINSLLQKIRDHSMVMQNLDIQMALMWWALLEVKKKHIAESNTKKTLHIASDIYAITKGKCMYDELCLEAAMKELELLNAEIAPDDFASEVLRDSSCLPLYIKDELNYNDNQIISDYGSIVYQAYKLAIDPNIQDLSVARKESLEELCLPLLKNSIAKKNIKSESASGICEKLIDDLKHLHSGFEQERGNEQKRIEEERKKQEQHQKELEEQHRKELEEQKRYVLTVASPSKLIECDLNNYTESILYPESDFSFRDEDLNTVKQTISSLMPAIIIKPSGLDGKNLEIENIDALIASLSDFYFCLWYKCRERDKELDKNAKFIVLIDYYGHFLYPSCYILDEAKNTFKEKPFGKEIKYNKVRDNIISDIYSEFFKEDMSEKVFNSKIGEGKIVLYRTFDSEKWITNKLEDVNVRSVKKFVKTLKSPDVRKAVIDMFYDFRKPAGEGGNE